MHQQHVILHLTLLEGIGPATITRIIKNKSAHIAWADLYHLNASDFMQWGFSHETAQQLVTGLASRALLEKELMLLERYAINYCTISCDSYPQLLKHIHQPPSVLYFQGASPQDTTKKIAVVGARKADQYGAQIVADIVPQLVAHGITIVSGGALGIDSMAHRTTIDAGGKTVVILGSGLLRPYPSSNKKLFNRVLELGGTMISSYPLLTEPFPGHFPARNRIIAGMSEGTLVVQAAEKSGARITAQFALEEGRDVFAIPGAIHDELSVGCHRLIQEGAKLVTHANDILIEYGIAQEETQMRIPAKKALPKNKYQPGSLEDKIMQLCLKAHSIDDLAAQTHLNLPELQTILFNLQLEGDLEQEFTGMWRSNL